MSDTHFGSIECVGAASCTPPPSVDRLAAAAKALVETLNDDGCDGETRELVTALEAALAAHAAAQKG